LCWMRTIKVIQHWDWLPLWWLACHWNKN
jgi:hypothetical protein